MFNTMTDDVLDLMQYPTQSPIMLRCKKLGQQLLRKRRTYERLCAMILKANCISALSTGSMQATDVYIYATSKSFLLLIYIFL